MILLNQIDSHQIPADRFRDPRTKESEGDKVEGRRPHHRITGDKTRVETTVAMEFAAS